MVSGIVVIVVGVILSVVVGRTIERAGRPFLDDVFRDERISGAMARLLSVLFYLLAIGSAGLIATVPVLRDTWIYDAALKLGIVLLVLGAAHGSVIGILVVVK